MTPIPKLKLHGFNNLTKSLNVCIYDINYAKTTQHQKKYIQYIDEQYNADRLTDILKDVCSIIGANVLNIAQQNYEPQGASVTILVAEEATATAETFEQSAKPGPLPQSIVSHLDKSHICVHTYPESHPVNGISTFRADIEISTCGVISPLKALNFLIHEFDADIVTLDYRVRGFTRDIDGKKHYIDHKIDSIQNFLTPETCKSYQLADVNLRQDNLFHTKMMRKEFYFTKYILDSNFEKYSEEQQKTISYRLQREIQEIFDGKNLSDEQN